MVVIIEQNPGILNNPELAYIKLKELSDLLQDIIDANPSKKINELF